MPTLKGEIIATNILNMNCSLHPYPRLCKPDKSTAFYPKFFSSSFQLILLEDIGRDQQGLLQEQSLNLRFVPMRVGKRFCSFRSLSGPGDRAAIRGKRASTCFSLEVHSSLCPPFMEHVAHLPHPGPREQAAKLQEWGEPQCIPRQAIFGYVDNHRLPATCKTLC